MYYTLKKKQEFERLHNIEIETLREQESCIQFFSSLHSTIAYYMVPG